MRSKTQTVMRITQINSVTLGPFCCSDEVDPTRARRSWCRDPRAFIGWSDRVRRKPHGHPQIVDEIELRGPIPIVLQERCKARTLESPKFDALPNPLLEQPLSMQERWRGNRVGRRSEQARD